MKIVITTDANCVYVSLNDVEYDQCIMSTISRKGSINRLLLKNNEAIGNIIVMVFNTGERDEVHYSMIESIDGETFDNNTTLYNKLKSLLL
jgi:hypothetical protein